MKSVNLIPILILVLILSGFRADQKLTSEQIWSKYLDSFGEREVVKNVKTFASTNIVESERGQILTNIKIKAPDKVLMEVFYPGGAKFTYVLNGKVGRMKSQMGVQDIPESYLKSIQNMGLIFPELYYENIVYKGEESFDNKAYYNFEVQFNGSTMSYLIDTETFTTFRIVSDDAFMEVLETVEIDGVRLIQSSKTTQVGQSFVAKYYNFEINLEMPDSLFELF
jgi:hypothetical protein